MPKKKRAERRFANPDFRPRHHFPAPPVEEIERRLRSVLTPDTFAAARYRMSAMGLRERARDLAGDGHDRALPGLAATPLRERVAAKSSSVKVCVSWLL